MSSRASAGWEADLRIVLIGGRHGVKSSVGNIILGKDVFKPNRRTANNVVGKELVSGRHVTVINTPGWKSAYPLALTPKLTQLEFQQSVNLFPPGPHAFVLVIPLDTPHVGTGMSVKEHMSVLGDHVWRHVVVVFTVTDKSKMAPGKDLIASDSDLASLIQKCENRFHVLNIGGSANRRQVTELLATIDQMVTSNGHYETDKAVSEGLEEMKKTISRSAVKRREKAQKQRTRLQKDDGLTDVRIMLMGRQRSGKSSAGNTILGRSVFKVDQRSVRCEVKVSEVAGKHLTVVDVPGWYYNSPLQDTSEMDKLEIQNSVFFCPPGPHAVLILVPVDEAFTKEQRVAVGQHLLLLTPSVWSHAIVLFTRGDCLGDRSIEQHIEAEGEDLRWLLDKCANRYHVFSNTMRDDTQVTELLEKVGQMVSGNTEGHYEDGGDVCEKISENQMLGKAAQRLMARTHRQRAVLKALFEGYHQSLPDVRVMLVAGEHSGRSKAGNHILQETVFAEFICKEFKTQTKLTECDRQERQVAERNVMVVNCPDWSTAPPSKKIKDVLLHGVTLCSPGPHAVLVTVDVRSSFSEADRRSVEELMKLLGDRVWRYALVLFTWGWWLGVRPVEEYIVSEGEHLRWLLEKCGYRYQVLQLSKWDNSPEVTEMMEKIEDMVTMNRGHFDPLESKERSVSVKEPGYFKGRRDEDWKKREEEMIERMLKAVVMEPEEPTLPAVRRRRSMDWLPPSLSGETTSETGGSYCLSPSAKVADWLKRYPGPIVTSSGYDSMSEDNRRLSRGSSVVVMSDASCQTDTSLPVGVHTSRSSQTFQVENQKIDKPFARDPN